MSKRTVGYQKLTAGMDGDGWELIAIAPSTLTQSDRLHLLQTLTVFTGKCPQYGNEFTETPDGIWIAINVDLMTTQS